MDEVEASKRAPRTEVVAEEPSEEDARGLRFDDPYWDDAYCTWLDTGLRSCCS